MQVNFSSCQPNIAERLHQSFCNEQVGESAWMWIKPACPELDIPLVGKEDRPGVQAAEFPCLTKLQRPFQKEIQLGIRPEVGLRKQDQTDGNIEFSAYFDEMMHRINGR